MTAFTTNSKVMYIFRFDDAPEEYQRLSPNGGDKEFLMFVPSEVLLECPSWLDLILAQNILGCSSYDEIEVQGGMIYIGAHA